MRRERRKEKGERRKEKGERRKEKGERRKRGENLKAGRRKKTKRKVNNKTTKRLANPPPT